MGSNPTAKRHNLNRGVAQLVERVVWDHQVARSSRVTPTHIGAWCNGSIVVSKTSDKGPNPLVPANRETCSNPQNGLPILTTNQKLRGSEVQILPRPLGVKRFPFFYKTAVRGF